MSHYLFVHFREKTSPDGEQVHFGLSKDGFNWEAVNEGKPVLWAYYGDKGVRDHTIIRNSKTGKFHILATDLSLAYGMRNQYNSSWSEITVKGSKYLSMWESDDLMHWSEQQLVEIGTDDLGCVWAPDIIRASANEVKGEYIVHWSSPNKYDGFREKRIYYSKTCDFKNFSEPAVLYKKEDSGCIDSAMYEENGSFYLFVKSEGNPVRLILLKSESPTGPWERVRDFDKHMEGEIDGAYEAPTAVRLDNGKWCLFVDYFGVQGVGQGYVPFIADSLEKANFARATEKFFFPYGFKHGTILRITEEEYKNIKSFNYNIHDYSKY